MIDVQKTKQTCSQMDAQQLKPQQTLKSIGILTNSSPTSHQQSSAKTGSTNFQYIQSRGSAMLKAALSDRNRSTDRQEVQFGAKMRSREEYVKAKLMQQAAQLKSQQRRKRTNKNNVLFSEPVVTKKYEYEQTTVLDIPLSSDSSSMSTASSDSSDSDRDAELSRRTIFQPRRRRFRQARSYLAMSANKLNEQLLKTSLSDDKFEYGTYATFSPDTSLKKRSRDMVEDSDEELEANADGGFKKSDGSLFSSPKIAKIAPYQDDQSDACNQTSAPDLDSANSQSKSIVQNRINPHQRTQSSVQTQLKYNNNNNSHNNNNNNSSKSLIAKKVPQSSVLAEIETSNPVSELISYKPKHSSDIEDSCKDEVVVADNGQSEVGYFGWLTSKISYLSQNVFNKITY